MNNGDNPKRNIPKVFTICAIIFVSIFVIVNISGVTAVLSSVLSVLSPIIIGFALAYILNPMLRFYEFRVFKKLKRKNAIRAISIACTLITTAIIVAAFLWLLIPQVVTSVKDLVTNYDDYVNSTVSLINSMINNIAANDHFTEYVSADEIKEWVLEFFASSSKIMSSILDYVSELGVGLFVGVKNTILGIFIAIYVLIAKERLQALARKLGAAFIPGSKLAVIGKYINLTHQTFSGFLVGKIIDSAIILVITLVLLLIFGIHYPLLIAVIVGVTNIVPVFGPFIGAIPSFFILFIVDPKEALIFLILIFLIQQLDGNVIGPKILGNSTGISSLGVLIAIVIMGEYFGVVGMIIGVPIFAVGGVIITEIADAKLTKRGKTTDLDEYYFKDAMIDPSHSHAPILTKLFGKIAQAVLKLIGALKNKKTEKKNNDAKKSTKDGKQ